MACHRSYEGAGLPAHFIPQSEHAAIRACTSTYDCSDAFEAAMASISVPNTAVVYIGGPEIIFPYGKCYFDRNIELTKTMTLTGYGQGGRTAWSTKLEFKAGSHGIGGNYLTTLQGTTTRRTVPLVITDPDHPTRTPVPRPSANRISRLSAAPSIRAEWHWRGGSRRSERKYHMGRESPWLGARASGSVGSASRKYAPSASSRSTVFRWWRACREATPRFTAMPT